MTLIKTIFQKKLILIPVLVVVGFMLTTGLSSSIVAEPQNIDESALLPDITPGVPKHLHVHNQGQNESLRFTNVWANVGDGALEFQEGPVVGDKQQAFQNLYDDEGNFGNIFANPSVWVFHEPVGEFIFHPTHNHWHIDDVGDFSVREFTDPNPEIMGDEIIGDIAPGAENTKIGFCIVDVYRYDDIKSSPSSQRVYWDCETDLQGIQPGWADQYHQSVEGNEIDITNVPDGEYLLVHQWNPLGLFIDADESNNKSWVKFVIEHENNGNGNRKVTVTGEFAPECQSNGSTPGICGDIKKNS